MNEKKMEREGRERQIGGEAEGEKEGEYKY